METHNSQAIEQFYSDYDIFKDHGGIICPENPGTFCEGIKEGAFVKKFNECELCAVYQRIIEEDNDKFIPMMA